VEDIVMDKLTTPIAWESDFQTACLRARDEQKAVLIYFHKPNWLGCQQQDTVTYSNEAIAQYIGDHLTPYQAELGARATGPLFRSNHVIWTPSAGLADHKGNVHYLAVGFMPPAEFLSTLRIGRARCLMAWMRYGEAVAELEQAASAGNTMAAEALFWLAAAYYFAHRNTTRMYATWAQLRARYPESSWARRTYAPPG
jgi:hypothetical protein